MLDQLETLTRRIRTLEIADDRETADVIGRLTKIIGDLIAYKRDLISELPGPVVGAVYQVTEQNKAKRSYNTAAIVSAFAAQDVSLSDLVRADVARISWQWTKLKAVAYANGVEMRIASGEIEDTGEVGGPLVGEVWESSMRSEAV